MSTRSNVTGKDYKVEEDHVNIQANVPAKGTADEEEEAENYIIIPPNGGWGWVIVLSAFYCNLVTDGIQLTFGVFLQDIANHFNIEKSKVSLIGSLMFGVHLLIGPLCSGLSNAHGIRPVTAIGSLITAFALSMCYFITHYGLLYFFYGFLGGVGLGLIYMNSIVITSLYFTTLRILAVSIVVCGTGFGTVVFALLGNELLKLTNWQTSFLIEAALAGTILPAAMTFRPLRPKRIIFTTDQTILARNISATSRISKVSRVSKASIFSDDGDWSETGRSRRATVFIQKYSTLSPAVNNLAHDTILKQLSAHLFPQRCCRHCKCCRRESVVYINPEEKSEGWEELVEIPHTAVEYKQGSQTSIATYLRTPSNLTLFSRHIVEVQKKKPECHCKPVTDMIKMMLDFKLMKSYAFVLFCLSGACAMSSFIVVLTYERDKTIIHGFSEDMGTYLIATLGGANMFWRLVLGIASTIRVCRFNIRVTSVLLSIIGGLAITFSGLWHELYLQFTTCIFYALGLAGFAVYRPGLLIELVGSELVLNATGISLLFMGIGGIVAPPLSGLLMESTGNYDAVMYTAGALLALSGLLLIGTLKSVRRN